MRENSAQVIIGITTISVAGAETHIGLIRKTVLS